MTTSADLSWWITLAPTLEWAWAKTYARRAPHWYVVEGPTPGMNAADFGRAGRVIRAVGEPGRFWAMTQLYLFTEDCRRKYWCMWSRPFRGEPRGSTWRPASGRTARRTSSMLSGCGS